MVLQISLKEITERHGSRLGPRSEREENLLDELSKLLGKTSKDAEQIPFSELIRTFGTYDSIRFACLYPDFDHGWRAFALWCCSHTKDLLTDERSRNALNVVSRYIHGQGSKNEMQIARARALDAIFGYDSFERRLFNRLFHEDRKNELGSRLFSTNHTRYRESILEEAAKVGMAEERIAMEAAAGCTNPSPTTAALMASGWTNDARLGRCRVDEKMQASILIKLVDNDYETKLKLIGREPSSRRPVGPR